MARPVRLRGGAHLPVKPLVDTETALPPASAPVTFMCVLSTFVMVLLLPPASTRPATVSVPDVSLMPTVAVPVPVGKGVVMVCSSG